MTVKNLDHLGLVLEFRLNRPEERARRSTQERQRSLATNYEAQPLDKYQRLLTFSLTSE